MEEFSPFRLDFISNYTGWFIQILFLLTAGFVHVSLEHHSHRAILVDGFILTLLLPFQFYAGYSERQQFPDLCSILTSCLLLWIPVAGPVVTGGGVMVWN